MRREEGFGYPLPMRSAVQSGLASGARRRLSTLTRRPARLAWAALILAVLWARPAASLASETPGPSTAQLATAAALPNQSAVIADLDGDSHADVAIVKPEGWGPRGFQYRIELRLTTRAGTSSFSVAGETGGLRIVARDVDGDGDLDLVIKSARSLTPVGVWINDGHGGFTEGDPGAYPPSIWSEGPGVVLSHQRETFQAIVPDSHRRSCIDFCVAFFASNELFLGRPSLVLMAAHPLSAAVSLPQTRAPPRTFPQLPS